MYGPFSQEGNVTVITGATAGLGRANAIAFAKAGSHVVVADLKAPQETAKRLRAEGVRATALELDIADIASIRKFKDAVYGEYGKVDTLVNNAGVFQVGATLDMDFEEDWRRVMRVNVDGTFRMCQEFGREMVAAKSGNIINIASKSGIMVDYPNPQVAYNVSKAAIIMMTKSLAIEWAPYGVRVNCVCPGNMAAHPQNPMIQKGHPYGDAWIRKIPRGTWGLPAELDTVMLYLASAASSFTTGAVEVVDGGYTLI
ncbi:MAG: SDR family NAD(P)-dependent oxidoreductase [Christensenellales bacterium]|jgi:NAD(P)-dependent dehydrogenase (short-subunit alcohol dehydrogenase family)